MFGQLGRLVGRKAGLGDDGAEVVFVEDGLDRLAILVGVFFRGLDPGTDNAGGGADVDSCFGNNPVGTGQVPALLLFEEAADVGLAGAVNPAALIGVEAGVPLLTGLGDAAIAAVVGEGGAAALIGREEGGFTEGGRGRRS